MIGVVQKLETDLDSLKTRTANQRHRFTNMLGEIISTITKIEDSRSGSWQPPYAELYYKNFQKPPLGKKLGIRPRIVPSQMPFYWIEKTYEDIESYVQRIHKDIELDKIRDEINKMLEECEQLHSWVCVQLVFLRDLPDFSKELDTLNQIQNHKWQIATKDLIHEKMPKQFVTTGLQPLQVIAPPHIRYESVVLNLLSKISGIELFLDKSVTLLQQIKVRISFKTEHGKSDAMETIALICNRFHAVAKALGQRHSNRETIELRDEYDVQDLMRTLLQIYFDDIRPEEWVPSYAGSSSRMDFLLKKEKIVVDVKFDLGDREIGNQLSADIVRYKEHPDCKTLICFVYDPKEKVRNPRGLESDINKQSDNRLIVQVIIRP